MTEESIEEARKVIITSLNVSKIMELDRYELIFNIDYLLRNYEKETGIKVKKKVIKSDIRRK